MKNKCWGSTHVLYHYVLAGFMLQYCIAVFSQYHFKGSMTKKEDNSDGCKTDLKRERTTQSSPKTGNMI